mmetsp:Transcript_15113/g.25872  ORF Transcript_15113/g.25872 Transcript_15113/m.25872 type:complete len:431 (+) Transcript_15113:128-1420(+)
MNSDVVLSTSSDENNTAHLWDLRTSTLLFSYKNVSAQNASVALIGRNHFASSEPNKSLLHIWQTTKEQAVIKSSTPEKILSLTATRDGVFIFGASVSGKLYGWEVSTGNLISVVDIHYKAVTCLCLCDDDTALASGAEDAIIHVWFVSSLLDEQAVGRGLAPFKSWSDHSLPITCLRWLSGGFAGRLISTSLDRTCRMWDAPSGALLATLVMPCALHCALVDPLQTVLFAGAATGDIFVVDLTAAPFPRAPSPDAAPHCLAGHTGAVSCLAISADGCLLVSASADSTVRIWDVRSRQHLRTMTQHKGAVTSLAVLPFWPDVQHQATGAAAVQRVQVLKRHMQRLDDRSDPVVVLRGCADEGVHPVLDGSPALSVPTTQHDSASTSWEVRQAELEADNAQLRNTNERWQVLANQLYGEALQAALPNLRPNS